MVWSVPSERRDAQLKILVVVVFAEASLDEHSDRVDVLDQKSSEVAAVGLDVDMCEIDSPTECNVIESLMLDTEIQDVLNTRIVSDAS